MRIATSTIYNNQTLSIDNLQATYQQQASELSSGIALNVPSDDPSVIAQDLSIRNDSAVTTQVSSNLTNLNNLLATTDSTLSSLTGILQSARNLAIEGATDTITTAQRSAIGAQVNQLLEQAIGLGNTKYDGKYIFAGTNVPPGSSLVQGVGQPPTAVATEGNLVQQSEELPSGQLVPTNVTLQQAFNLNASNGSPSIFDMLIRLRDTLDGNVVTDESSSQVNMSDQAVLPTTTLASLTSTAPPILSVPLTADSNNQVSFAIASSLSPTGTTLTFNLGSSVQQVVAAINADTSATGVSATFNYQAQRFSFTDPAGGTFSISNVASAPGLATIANFTSAFLLSSTADVVTDLSTQLGDLDTGLTVALSAAGTIGATVQTVSALSSTEASRGTSDTKVQSNLEDADIAKVTSQFTLTQTALQAAYSTTTRVESENLFTYLPAP